MNIDNIIGSGAKKDVYGFPIQTNRLTGEIARGFEKPNKSEESTVQSLSKSIKNELIGGGRAVSIKESEINKLSEAENKAIETFIENDKGTRESKLEAVRAAVKKGVPVNETNLRAVMSALSSGNRSGQTVGIDECIGEITEAVSTGSGSHDDVNGLVKTAKEVQLALKNLGIDTSKSVEGMTIVAVGDGEYALDTGQTSQLAEMLKTGGVSGREGLSQVNEFISKNALDISVDDKMKSRQSVDLTLTQEELEGYLYECIDRLAQNVDAVTASVLNSLQFRQVVRVEVTAAMSVSTDHFNALKTGMSMNVEKMNSAVSVKSISVSISAMIDEMDSFIMKSDALLYTSMKTEKRLLGVTSELQNARNELEKGNTAMAKKIAESAVKALVDINFQPSYRRAELHVNSAAKRFVTGENINYSRNQYNTLSVLRCEEKTSARIMLELMRSLGINNESEVSEIFERFSDEADIKKKLGKDFVNDNVKAVLMKLMMRENDDKTGGIQKLTDTLFGTQLLNRQDSSKTEQTMMFSVPMPQSQTDARVIINGKRKGCGIDEENCSLYFSFETVKLGFTGIKVQITSSRLNISVYNDEPASRDMLKRGFDDMLGDICDLGFVKAGVNISSFEDGKSDNLSDNADTCDVSPAGSAGILNNEEGAFDFKL